MEVFYLLIPISLIIVSAMVWIFFWAVKSGQFDDLEGPAYRILEDDQPDLKSPTSLNAGEADAEDP